MSYASFFTPKPAHYLSLIILFLTLMTSCKGNNFNETEKLLDDLFTRHDHRVRPALNQSSPTTVFVTVSLVSLVGIQEIGEKIILNAWINFRWKDEIRTWDPADYGGLEIIHPDPQDVWRPHVVISNSLKDRDMFKDDVTSFSLSCDGVTTWYTGAVFEVSCGLDLTHFPFDEQTCMMKLLATDFAHEVVFHPVSNTLKLGSYNMNEEWALKDSSVVSKELSFNGELLSQIGVTVTYKRRPTFFVIHILIPAMMLSLVSLLVYILPDDSGERASFSVTVLLALSMFLSMVSGELPHDSKNVPVIMAYLLSLLVINAMNVLVTVSHLRMVSRHKEQRQGPQNEKNLYLCSPYLPSSTLPPPVGGCEENKHLDPNVKSFPESKLSSSKKTSTRASELEPQPPQGSPICNKPVKPQANPFGNNAKNGMSPDDQDSHDDIFQNVFRKVGKHPDVIMFLIFVSIWFPSSICFLRSMNAF